MNAEEFGAAVRAAVGVINCVQLNRTGRMADAEYTAQLGDAAEEVGGAGYLVLPLATVALRLARLLADEQGAEIDDVIRDLGADYADPGEWVSGRACAACRFPIPPDLGDVDRHPMCMGAPE